LNSGYYGNYKLDSTEPEQLAGLCSEILYRDLIQSIVDRIPAGVLRKPTEKFVTKFIDQTVSTAVCGAWNSSSTACKSAKAGIEETCKSLLEPLFEEEVKLKESIAEKVNEKTLPFLEDVGNRVCQPVLKVIAAPISKAYAAAITDFSKYMKAEVAAGKFKGKKKEVKKAIHEAHRELEWYHSGPLAEANHVCWELYVADDLGKVASLFGDGFTTYTLYSETISAIRDLCHRAVHAFATALHDEAQAEEEEETADSKEKDQDALLTEVLTRFLHDAKLSLKGVLEMLLGGMLQGGYESAVIGPCGDIVAPLQAVIEAIPGVSSLIDLNAMTEEVLQRVLDDAVGTFVESAYGQVEAKLDNAGSELDAGEHEQ
jgi:hypothetical protein